MTVVPWRSEMDATPSAYGHLGSLHVRLLEFKTCDASTTKSGFDGVEKTHLYDDGWDVVSKPLPNIVTVLPPAASP
jgi:hypothetical protein